MRNLLRNAAFLVTLNLIGGLSFPARAFEASVTTLEPVQAQDEHSPQNKQNAQNAKVPMCANIQLAATYMPRSAHAGGPAFQFAVHNGTDEAVSLAMPAPTSAHWYALEGSRWSWRASNGAGGSPVDAMDPGGRVFAFRVNPSQNSEPGGERRPRKLIVEAHGFLNWEVKPADNPVVNFKPSCPHCNHPTDRQFRVVFAYAVLPGNGEQGMLRCGLRTGPVAVPASYARWTAEQTAQNRVSALKTPATLVKTASSAAHPAAGSNDSLTNASSTDVSSAATWREASRNAPNHSGPTTQSEP